MKTLLTLLFMMMSLTVRAAETVSPSGGVMKMVLGLATVLAVMGLVAWVLKRLLPNIGHNKQSVVRVVGGVSVGSRERVVVVEVADRWIVLGVAPGQVNGIANLEAGSLQTFNDSSSNHSNQFGLSNRGFTQALAPSFAQWLQKSAAKFTEPKLAESKSNEPNFPDKKDA